MRINSATFSPPVQSLQEADTLAGADSKPVNADYEGIEGKRYKLTNAWPQAIDAEKFDQLESAVNSKQSSLPR